MKLAGRPSTPTWSYGLKRAEILSAAANGVTLLVVGALLLVEAIQRPVHPSNVHALPMLIVASVGVVVNSAHVVSHFPAGQAPAPVRTPWGSTWKYLFGVESTRVG